MDERARGVLDAVFAKETDADVEREARKEEIRREFADRFIGWVLKEIEAWCADDGKVGFGKKLCLEGDFVPPDDLRDEMPQKYKVLAFLERALGNYMTPLGFEVSVSDRGREDDDVKVKIWRKRE